MYGWFDFSDSSNAGVFGQSALCGDRGEKEWWRGAVIRPLWKIGNQMHHARWWLEYRLNPKHRYHLIDSKLEPGYHDVDTLILHGCFSLLCRYVELEHDGAEKLTEWAERLKTEPDKNAPEGWQTAQGVRESEAVALYRWWKFEKPAEQVEYDRMLNHLYGRKRSTKTDANGHKVWSVDEPWTEADSAMNDEMRALEDKMNRDEQEMLKRLIDVRGSLWT
jgi:hypothetical protein